MCKVTKSPMHYDVLIIGGGIYGSAMLWEASHRGAKSILLEKNDFASASSANSLKTIHGGIRYLQQANIKKALSCDAEKSILRHIAPQLIQPLDCFFPADNYHTKSPLSFFMASELFNRIRRYAFRKNEILTNGYVAAGVKKIALANSTHKSSCLFWQDAQATSTEQLVLSYITTSKKYNADAHNYSEVSGVVEKNDRSYVITYTQDGQQKKCTANVVIDCTNSDFLRKATDNYPRQCTPHFVTGVNVILDGIVQPGLFALPSHTTKKGMLTFASWQGSTIAGTWYFSHKITDKSQIKGDILTQCVDDISAAFTKAKILISKKAIYRRVLDIHIGQLPADKNNQNYERALIQKAQIQQIKSNLYQVNGNKYTTARLNAKKMIDVLVKTNVNVGKSMSHKIKLSGFAQVAQVINTPSPLYTLMAKRYGETVNKMPVSIEEETKIVWVPGSDCITTCEVAYFSEDTTIKRLSDLLYRRLSINIHRPISFVSIQWIALQLAPKKGWNKSALHQQIGRVVSHEAMKSNLSIKHKN